MENPIRPVANDMGEIYNSRISKFLNEIDMLQDALVTDIFYPGTTKPILHYLHNKFEQLFYQIVGKM